MRIFDLTISNRWRQFSDCMGCIHAVPEAWHRVRQYYYNIYIVCVAYVVCARPMRPAPAAYGIGRYK